MTPITISRGKTILAHHTTDHPRSSYGQPIWSIEVERPRAGRALWVQGDNQMSMVIYGYQDGWLICRQPDGLAVGILWSDGVYYADCIIDTRTDKPVKLRNGLKSLKDYHKVRGTVYGADGFFGRLGSIVNMPAHVTESLATISDKIKERP